MLAIDDLMRQGQQHHITLTKIISNAIWPQVKFFISSDSEGITKGQSKQDNQLHFMTLDASVIKLMNDTPVLKINIVDLQGRTIYATDPDEVDKVMPDGYPGSTAAFTDKPNTELNFIDFIYTVKGLLKNRYVLSSYLPVHDPVNNEIRAIFEIHADVTDTYQKIIESRNNFGIAIIAILGLVYTALFLLVRRADIIIRRQANERERYLNEIEKINENLDQNARELAIAHDKAVEASTYKSQFLATMSHELRTPLNAIIGYSEMLTEDLSDTQHTQSIEDLNKIQNAGKHLLTVINEILDISKIEAGSINLHLEEFDVAEVIDGIASTIEPLARNGNNEFKLTCSGELGSICSDITRFRQILLNLLSNACKFTKDGVVELNVQRTGHNDLEQIICTVSDTGIGISPHNIEKIFKPFQQADSSTTREHGGTGLGLTISKRFCELLGGSIYAQSELNKGTRFTINLPVDATTAGEYTRARLAKPDVLHVDTSRPKLDRRQKISRILLIDNDPNARKVLQGFLEERGFSVDTASDGAKGLAIARLTPPDLITIDSMLPEMDGWDVLQDFKHDIKLKDIPVIMISKINEKYLHDSFGAAEYLTKPIDWDQFSGVIKKWVRIDNKEEMK